MNRALLYLYTRSLAGSVRQRVQRLRQPKYLFGALFGALYFYFYFYRFLFLRGTGGTPPVPITPGIGEDVGALLLAGAVLVFAWLMPGKRAGLGFSEAEIVGLFPAPLSRQQLIRYKLLTSQLGIFLFATLMTVVTGRATTGTGWLHLAGWWMIISIFALHRLGASFALTRLMERGMSNWQRRGVLAGVVVALGGALYAWQALAPEPPEVEELSQLGLVVDYLRALLETGPGPWLLLPFRIAVRPYFAPNGAAFMQAFWPAFGLLAVHYWWVMRADVSFEEASIALARKRAEFLASRQKGDHLRINLARGARAPIFRLRPTGFSAVAFVWKALIFSGGWGGLKIVTIGFAVVAAVSGAAVYLDMSEHASFVVCILGVGGFLFALLANISSGASYLRQDLPSMDLLQSLPIRGWKIVFGHLFAQAAQGTLLQWAALIIIAIGAQGLPGVFEEHLGEFNAAAIGLAILALPLNLTMMIVPAGALLLWPGWFRGGTPGIAIEAVGLRIILLLGQIFAVGVALLLPVAAIGSIAWGGITQDWNLVWIPVAAGLGAVVLAGEAWLGILLLGTIFERYDVAAD